MIENPEFHAIATGRATLEEAAHALEQALQGEVRAERIYGALRDWTWKALHSRRLDEGLSEWLDLIKGVQVRLPREREDARARLDVLADLVATSIRYAANVTDEELLGYSHVPGILRHVRRLNGHAARQALKDELKLGDARLSQLLTLLVHNGLLEREPRGREAHFMLTARGSDLLDRFSGRSLEGDRPAPKTRERSRSPDLARFGTTQGTGAAAPVGSVYKVVAPGKEAWGGSAKEFRPQAKLRGETEHSGMGQIFKPRAEQVVAEGARLDAR